MSPLPGRPPKFGTAMSNAERARLFRQRRAQTTLIAHEDLQAHSTAVLLASLAQHLKDIEQGAEPAARARALASAVVRALCQRHGLDLNPAELICATQAELSAAADSQCSKQKD